MEQKNLVSRKVRRCLKLVQNNNFQLKVFIDSIAPFSIWAEEWLNDTL